MKQHINAHSSTERFVPAQYILSDGTIEVYSNYMVSDHGRVGSLVDNSGNKRPVMKILKPFPSDTLGHLQVNLWVSCKRYGRSVHRLALSSFHPELYFEGAEVDHIDRNVANNYLANLHWTDRKGNNANRSNMKQIKVTHLSDGHIELFDNMHDVDRAFGKCMRWCCNVILQCKGFNAKLNILIEKI